MNHAPPSRLAASAIAACLALAGCSTAPVVRWDGGDPAASGASMPRALRYLEAARAQYRHAVAAQINDERTLGNALIGAGALVAALAVGKVHRDAIVGTSFVGGTGYALGNANLQRPRVMIYQAGVEALNCAERAVAPFAMEDDELAALVQSLDRLERARIDLGTRLAEGRSERAAALPASAGAQQFDVLLTAAQQVQQASDTTLRAGREFTSAARIGARQLVAAVNGIDAAVVRSVINATPDLSNVPRVISGLAGMVGSFAPGAGIEALVEQRLGDLAKARTGAEGQASAMDRANDAVRVAMRELAARHAEASARLAGRTAAWPADAFKDCGVEQVVAALSVSPGSLVFTASTSSRRLLDVAGGVKPYFVEIDGPAIDGLVLKPPVRFDTRAEVSVDGAKVKGPVETVLRVSDSSPTARTISVPLSVVMAGGGAERAAAPAPPAPAPAPASAAPPPAAGPATAPAATPRPAPANATPLGETSRFMFQGQRFDVIGVPRRVGDAIEVTVRCPAGSTTVFSRADLVRALLAEAGVTANPPPKVALKSAPAACIRE